MFWIGLICLVVGVIIGAISGIGYFCYLAMEQCGSLEDIHRVHDVMVAATENRESEVIVYHNGEIIQQATFEEL